MKNKIKKIKIYLRNKIYSYIEENKSRRQIKHKISNIDAFNKIFTKPNIIKFNKGFEIKCLEKDKNAVLETCVNEDYTRDKKTEIRKGDIIFDIGAHIGSFSINAANSGAKVYAFEPNKDNLKIFKENVALNSYNKIDINDYGLYNKNAKLRLYIKDNTGGHSILDKGKLYEEVVVKDINDVIREKKIQKINLLKIDVEGSEYKILPHISKENYKKIDKIVGEYHLMPRVHGNYKMIKKILEEKGFNVYHKIPYYFIAIKD